MRSFNHFDILAPIYDRVIGGHQIGNLIRLANLPINGILLDVGGGTGRVSARMQNRVSKVVIVDSSFKMLIQAKGKKELNVVCALAEKLPFPENFFDRIIMVDAFHHVFNQRETSLELWRLLKPKGRIVIEEPNIEKLSVRILSILEKLALMQSHFMSPNDIAKMFDYPNSSVRIVKERFNSWIIIHKFSSI